MNIRTLFFPLLILSSTSTFAADEIHWTFSSQTAVTFDWRGSSAESSIRYGTAPGIYTHSVTAQAPNPVPFSSPGPFWEAKLTKLQENTRYYYSIGDNPEHTFKTAPKRGDSGFTIFAQGDIGDTSSYFRMGAIQDIIANGRPDFVVGLGDLTYGNAHGQEAVDQHFNDIMVWSRDAAYMPIWGNHEWDKSTDDLRNYKGRFELPNPQTSPGSPDVSCCGEDWYWFDYGNVRFIALPEPWSGAWADWSTHAATLMEEAQSDPDITFVVTFVHRPTYSSGHHSGSSKLKRILGDLGDRFNKYVLNLNGHSHDYERTHPQHGVVHITAGASGSSLEIDGSCLWKTCVQPSWSAYRAMHLGALKLYFSKGGIQGAFICGPAGAGKNDVTCNQGDIIDNFTIGQPATDSTAPSVPSNVNAIATSNSQIDLSWTASTDDISVTGYKIFRNNIQIATTSKTSYFSVNLSPSTSYTYSVTAFDAAGNISGQSTAVTVSTLTTTTIYNKSIPTILFTPTDDATIKPGSANSNYGSKKLEADSSSEENFLIKFNVTGTSGRSISGAKLRLYNINGSNIGGNFYRVADNSWSESTVTWNNAPNADKTLLAKLGSVTADNWYEVDVSSLITSDGTYSLRITSTSSNGADYRSKETADFAPQLVVTLNSNIVTSDIESPSIPTNLSATAVSTSQVDLSWLASTDNIDVSGYAIFRDNIQIATASTASYSDTKLSPATSYTYTIHAFDKAGNKSEKSAASTVTTFDIAIPDTISPSTPVKVSAKTLSTSQIDLSWQASTDNIGVSGYRIYRNDIKIASTSSTAYSDSKLSASTNYKYTVTAFDEAGNASSQSSAVTATTLSISSKQITLTFTPTDDATVKPSYPTTNFGSKKLETDKSSEENFLMKFTVSGINGGSVTNAKLRLYNINGSDKGGDFFFAADNSWSESTVNWKNAPVATGTAIASLGAVSSNIWYEVDLTSLITKDGSYSLRVTSTSRNGADYKSKETAQFSPKLIVTATAQDYTGNIKTVSINKTSNPTALAFIADPSLVFTVPQMENQPYLVPVIDPTFGSKVVRISNDTGASTSPVKGTWGSDARHHYSKDQPWNSDNTLLVLQNDGSPSQLILDGTTYQPKHGKCKNYSVWDDRWHPSLQHPHERINVNHDKLEWFDIVNCTQTRSWTLPFPVKYLGSGEGNTSFDGRFVLLSDATRMFLVDMDPQAPYASYADGNNSRIGPVLDISNCGLKKCQIDWVSVSPSGKYAVVSNSDHLRVFDIDPNTLVLTPRPMPMNSKQCLNHDPEKGYIFDLGHADMTMNPFNNNEDVIIGQRRSWCKGPVNGTEMGSVIMVRLKDNAVTTLTNPNNEAFAHHISARSYDRPGWVYVSYYHYEDKNRVFNDEIVAVKIDGSQTVERFVHKHSNNNDCYRCEAHAVPSRDGRRVLWATGSPDDIKAYVVDTKR